MTTLHRRIAATGLALAVAFSLAACGSSTTTPVDTAAAPTDGAVAAECTQIQTTLTNVGQRLEGLQAKIPGDIPGAIDDVQTSITELQSMSDGLSEGELKTRVDAIVRIGGELVDVLNQAQAGEISALEAAAQGASKLAAAQVELNAINDHCNWN